MVSCGNLVKGNVKSCGCLAKLDDILPGTKFNKLVVIEKTESRKGAIMYKCHCDCGKDKNISAFNLYTNHAKSCGCLREFDNGVAAFNLTLTRYKMQATKRNLVFDITLEQFKKLVESDCFYCGKPPSNRTYHNKMNGSYIYNGIDRVDNSKGYVIDNCVPCCKMCNWIKLHISKQDFYAKIIKIYNESASKNK